MLGCRTVEEKNALGFRSAIDVEESAAVAELQQEEELERLVAAAEAQAAAAAALKPAPLKREAEWQCEAGEDRGGRRARAAKEADEVVDLTT